MSTPSNPFPSTPPSRIATSSGRQFAATNKTSRVSRELFNQQQQDGLIRALEGTPKLERGSRSRPSVLKYPIDIGTGDVPHVMQFKVFWRWENKDIKEQMASGLNAAKLESEKKIGELSTIAGLIQNGNLTKEMLEQSGLPRENIAALKELANSSELLKIVDPSIKDNLATLLQTNPGKAKDIIEQTISSYQSRLSSIESELNGSFGKVGLDEQERLLIQNRLNEDIAGTKVGQSAITGAGTGAVAGGLLGLLFGGAKGAAIGVAGGAAAGAVVAPLAVAGAKAYQNQAVYDQMVSLYLPYCTKINNEDTFQYEDSSQTAAGAAFDFLGRPIETAAQGIEVGVEKAAGAVGAAGAGALARGKVVNPRLEKLFRQKDFRNFSFSWDFYPKTKEETEAIRNIIETFRYHAHPASDDTNAGEGESKVEVVLRVPAEFEIRFLSSNPNPNIAGFLENEYIPKIGRCALNSISVDYTSNSIYSSFVDNSPTAITLTLQFSEMGVLTREVVDKGF